MDYDLDTREWTSSFRNPTGNLSSFEPLNASQLAPHLYRNETARLSTLSAGLRAASPSQAVRDQENIGNVRSLRQQVERESTYKSYSGEDDLSRYRLHSVGKLYDESPYVRKELFRAPVGGPGTRSSNTLDSEKADGGSPGLTVLRELEQSISSIRSPVPQSASQKMSSAREDPARETMKDAMGTAVSAWMSFWDGIRVEKEFRLTSTSAEVADEPGFDDADPEFPGPTQFGPSILSEGASMLGHFANPTRALFTASLYNTAAKAPSVMLDNQLHDAESVISADSSVIAPGSMPPSAPPSISDLPPAPLPPPNSAPHVPRSRAGSVASVASSHMSGSAIVSPRGRSLTAVPKQKSPRRGTVSISSLQKIPEGPGGDTGSQSGMPSSDTRARAATMAAGRRERRVSLADTVKFSGGRTSTYDAVPKTESALLVAASVL
ncbi:hypothetical protein CYMTET_23606 [Cymbomonas tetramitiformis]|uniref:Uncharacterized protein n=1 Tax=Cymbomonas tetramitiformis TaxID=36881 RepID=A0AAE0FXV3_9CHLO|nr:hypothetical protein CYMTET_23606 [Cymbomonas tetramitiformis]